MDFGTGAPVITPDGKRRKTNVFRIVLSHSRKAYSEATFTQTAEDFFRCLENAFVHFGGVPKTLVIDNLRAAVAQPDWFDPELTPKVQSFCRHYGTVIRICPAECVLRPLIAWLRSTLGFDFSPEVNNGESSGAECSEGAVLA